MTKKNTYRLRTVICTLSAVIAVIASLALGITGRFTPVATAAPSTYLNFQARLKNSAGAIVPDGNYNIEFKLYNASTSSGSSQGSCSGDSACVWVETRITSDKVRVANGYLTVNLGSVNAFPSTIDWSEQHWLTMNIGGTGTASWDGEMDPRLLLTAVPYAFKAGTANTLTKTDSGNTTTVSITNPTTDRTVNFADASGTIALQTSGSSTTGVSAFVQGGVNWGTTAILGTADSQALNIQSSGLTRLTVESDGDLAVDTNTLFVDATGDEVGIGTNTPGAKLDVLATTEQLRLSYNGSQYTSFTTASNGDLTLTTTGHDININSNVKITPGQTGIVPLQVQMITDQNANNITVKDASTNNIFIVDSSGNVQVNNTLRSLNATSGNTNALYLRSGNATAGNSGQVSIDSGTASGTTGNVVIGTTSASAVLVGRSGIQTTIQGALAVSEQVTIGTSDTTGTLLVLDTKTDSGDPSGVNGAMYYNSNAGKFRCFQNSGWTDCIGAGGAGVSSVGTIDSQTKSADGVVISGSSIYMQQADGTYPGLVSVGTQTFAGAKTFSGSTTFSSSIDLNAGIAISGGIDLENSGITNTGSVAGATTGAFSTSLTSPLFTGSAAVTLSSGGTSDLTLDSASNVIQLAATDATVRRTAAGATTFDLQDTSNTVYAITNSGSGVANLTVDGSITASAGLTVSTGGAAVTGNSTVTGTLQVSSTLSIGASDTTGTLLALDTKTDSGDPSGVNGGMYYNSNAGKFRCYEGNAWKDCIATSGVTAVGAFSGSSQANGASISGSTITFGPADATNPGMVSTGTQTFAGAKTFTGAATFQNGSNSSTAFRIQNAGGSTLLGVDTTNAGNISLFNTPSGETGSWAATSTLPAARGALDAVVHNGYVYVVGGFNSTPETGVVYAAINADGTLGSWNVASSLPSARAGRTIAYGGYLYMLGGVNSSWTETSTVYYTRINADGSLAGWNTTTSLPGVRTNMGAVAYNGHIYISGGWNGSSMNDFVYAATINSDGTLGSWLGTTSLPQSRTDHTMTVANGYLYVVGGSDNGGNEVSTVYYGQLDQEDGSVVSWGSTNTLPAARKYGAVAVSNGYLYAIGGSNSSDTPQTSVYYARLNSNGTVGSWSTGANTLPAARSTSNAAVFNGFAYYIGGATTSSYTAVNTAYYARLGNTLSVGGNIDLVSIQGGSAQVSHGQSTGSMGGSITAGNGNFVGALQVQGAATFSQAVNIGGVLVVNGGAQFNGQVTIGTSDTNATLLVLDTKTTSADPTGTNGAMYYNSSLAKFRCYEDGNWKNCSDPSSLTFGSYFYEDFFNGGSGANNVGTNGMFADNTGVCSNANISNPDADNADRPGIIQMSTGTTTTGCGMVRMGTLDTFLLGGNTTVEIAAKVPTLSTGTEEFDVRLGFGDERASEFTDGVYFEYDRNASTSWRIGTASNGSRTENTSTNSSCSAGGSAVSVTADSWTRFKYIINSSATRVDFYINGTFVGCSTTNIPTAAGRGTTPMMSINKSAGTTARTLMVDYFQFIKIASSAR